MGTLRNVESSTLLQFTAVLTAAIALDLFKVVSKLFKAGLISQAQFRAARLFFVRRWTIIVHNITFVCHG